ncbi:MAG: transcriptional repressor [Desulfofustis sp.]|jgi:Fur family ferric uptake transcriptional regulator|nr:transcriptional repressor [Desulfofustis sp.]
MDMDDQSPKMRLTAQRQIILEELGKVTSHPTANEVYDMVRKRLPRIGLGTVYRNLELMAETGLILKLEVGGTQKRFDATTNLHYHVRCSECGRVDDIELPVQSKLDRLAAKACDYQILGHHIEFSGICPDCARATAKQISIN